MKFIHANLQSSSPTGIFFTFFLALGLLLHPAAVHAQETPLQSSQEQEILLDSVSVDIWPEYDQPAVLVIYHVTLSSQVSLPVTMSLRIPAAAGKPHAVAWQSPDKALFDLKYDSKAAGEWTEIQFNTPAPDVQIEYYDPTQKKTGTRRAFTFRWSGVYTVQNLSLQIQQPANATNFTFRPDVGKGQAGDFGLTYYTLLEGKVNAGTTFDLAMSYNKPDDTLTNPQQFQAAQPNQPVDSGTSGRVALDQFLPWGVGGLGLMLIAAGLFWYWRTGHMPSSTKFVSARPRHARSRSAQASAPAVSVGNGTFCHQCGKKASAGDVFCRACGTKLR